jgi:lysophospholipase L1-like esterase
MRRLALALLLALGFGCSDASAPESQAEPIEATSQRLCTTGAPSAWSPCPDPAAGPCRVMSAGDSLTVGCKIKATPCEAEGVPGAYRQRLTAQAAQGGRWLDLVGPDVNGPLATQHDREFIAQPGYRLDQLLTLTNQPVRSFKPRLIVAWGGTNDANQAITQAWMEYRWKSWRSDLLAGADIPGQTRRAAIVWLTLPPFCADPVVDARVQTFNTWLRSYVPQLQNTALAADPTGGTVTDHLVDVSGLLSCSLHFASDGIHLNQQGQDVVGDAVYARLTDAARPLLP